MADNKTKPQLRSPKAVISDAVTLGYKVIEDQILQGREAAERVRAGTYNAANAEADVKMLLDRVLELVKELGTAGFDLAAAAMRDSRAASPAKETGSTQSTHVAIETHGDRPAEVTCKFYPPSPQFKPSVPALYSKNPKAPPLKSIRLEYRDSRPVLVVDIPKKQPAGNYAGAIVDIETNQAGGFVSVSIR